MVLSGKVTGFNYVGGLVGTYKSAMSATEPYYMIGCSSAADVSGYQAGGLVGTFSYGSVSTATDPSPYGNCVMLDCYATGNVTPSYRDFGKTPVNGGLLALLRRQIRSWCSAATQRGPWRRRAKPA